MSRKLNKITEAEIDRSLRKAFAELASEPVPDRFHLLLQKLREDDAAPQDPSGDEEA